jgi:DNA-binding CsgD family transcriptional regulator
MNDQKKENLKGKEICMVLMPFKEPFDTYYHEIIEQTIIDLGLLPYRGDSLFRPSPIMNDIWDLIKASKIIIADLTEKNPNVFYELGLSHSIGKPVILITASIGDVPFDLQSLRVIIYNKENPYWGLDLKNKIKSSIQEIMISPTEAVPLMFRKISKSQAPIESEISNRISRLEDKLRVFEHELLIREDNNYDYINRKFTINEDTQLSNMEIKVLEMTGKAFKSIEIANSLNVSKRTIDSIRANIMNKLNIKSLPQLIKFAVEYSYKDEN